MHNDFAFIFFSVCCGEFRSVLLLPLRSIRTAMEKLPADLEVTVTELPRSSVRLNVKVPPPVCAECYGKVLADLRPLAQVPGFRPGTRVPEKILVSCLGEWRVREVAIDSILRRTLPHAMSSLTREAFKDSIRVTTNFSELDEAFSFRQNYLRYEAVVDVAPEVKWVTSNGYKDLKIVLDGDSDNAAQMACESEIRRLHKGLALMIDVTDRGLQIDDVAFLEIFLVKVGRDDIGTDSSADRKVILLDTEKEEDVDMFVPGFLESIVGIQCGETKSLPLVFAELQGVETQFEVVCTKLFSRKLPSLDDSLAERLLPGCNSLSELRESILQKINNFAPAAKEFMIMGSILDQLSKIVEVDIPRSLFEVRAMQIYKAKILGIQAKWKLKERHIMPLLSPEAVNEILENQRDYITNEVKLFLAIDDIIKRENLEVPMQWSAESAFRSVMDLKPALGCSMEDFEMTFMADKFKEMADDPVVKAIALLREHVTIQYVSASQTQIGDNVE